VRASAGHGKGIGTDAIRAALDFGFGNTDTERIWMFTMAGNTRSQRAFEKAGFRRDGVIRHLARVNGAWIDGVLMSILREEWQADDRKRSWDYIAAAPPGLPRAVAPPTSPDQHARALDPPP
jgi:ribosomal protein S18 acetylase RimI-like enzyme